MKLKKKKIRYIQQSCLSRTLDKIQERDFPSGPVVKILPCNAGDMGSILGLGTKVSQATKQLQQLSPESTVQPNKSTLKKIKPQRKDSWGGNLTSTSKDCLL